MKSTVVDNNPGGATHRLSLIPPASSPPRSIGSQLLSEHFETLADTPNSVSKLRDLVLQLAVRGRLVPQSTKDESGAQLLKRVLEQKHRLNREGVIKKTPSLDAITSEDCPFVIPDNWAWAHLNDFGDWGSGSTPNRGNHEFYDGTIPWLKSGELNDGTVSESEEKVTDLALQKCSLRLNKPGDVLLAMYGATVGKVAILGAEATTNQAVCACTCFSGVFNRYLFFLLKAYKQQFISESAGAAQPNFSKDKIIRTIAPLPPLPEQHRIVAKVEELLALCDELEATQVATQERRTRLVHSALDHLTSVKDEQDFSKRASFVLDNATLILDDIFTLRHAILSLAVEGRIVLRKAEEGVGKEVLTRFSLHDQPDPDHILDEHFPAHWAITAFSNLARIRSGVTKGRNLTGRKTEAFPYLRVANVQRGYLELDVMKDIEIPVEELEKFRLEPNDLLITEGGDWDKVGRTAIWRGEIPDCIHQNHVFRGRLVSDELLPEWFMLYFNSPVGRRYFESAAKQTTNLASINATELRGCPVPIPPLAEQARIVSKVQELMRWCDELESQLTTARTAGTRLLDATLDKLLSNP
jgi:type I restriction enzyme S subunit